MAKLYYRYGAMNAGKSAALLQVAHNYSEQGMYTILIKPSLDTKGGHKIVSRIGLERPVDLSLTSDMGIVESLPNTQKPYAIIVDEAQFLTPDQVDELYFITKIYDIPVLCYGLRCDSQMQGFPGSTRLLQIADDLEELKTICKCGKKATQNVRYINGEPTFGGSQVAIDGEAEVTYQSMCGECYLKLREECKHNGRNI